MILSRCYERNQAKVAPSAERIGCRKMLTNSLHIFRSVLNHHPAICGLPAARNSQYQKQAMDINEGVPAIG
jgi:hypothetical protein